MNQQREVIYSYRRSVLKGYSLKREVQEMIEETIDRIISENISFDSSPDEWNLEGLLNGSNLLKCSHRARRPGIRPSK